MTAAPDAATNNGKPEPATEHKFPEERVAPARGQRVPLTRPDGLPKQSARTVPDIASNQEITRTPRP